MHYISQNQELQKGTQTVIHIEGSKRQKKNVLWWWMQW